LQISTGCDNGTRLEWLLPYLLIYVAADRTAPLLTRSDLRTASDDTVPRSIVLSHLAQVISGLSQIPRSERNLFTAFFMPQLAALPGPQNPVLRAQAARSLPAIAQAALRLQEAAAEAALRVEDDASASRSLLICLFFLSRMSWLWVDTAICPRQSWSATFSLTVPIQQGTPLADLADIRGPKMQMPKHKQMLGCPDFCTLKHCR
jgi:hypothetical protein